MSDGLKEMFCVDPDESYMHSLYYVNFASAIVSKVKKEKPFKYEGYVLKNDLAAFESYEIEAFSEWLTANEYIALSDKERRQYSFYRWNDPYGKYGTYSEIAQRIWTLCKLFQDACADDIGGSLYNGITDSQVRVYIYIS